MARTLFRPLLLLTLFLSVLMSSCRAEKTADEQIIADILQRCQEYSWKSETYIDSLASCFLGSPYVAATLESEDGEENLVINLRELDCMTLVENVLALHRLLHEAASFSYREEVALQRFPEILEEIRYRQGQRQNYASRLHYTSEWIVDNTAKGYVKEISSQYSEAIYQIHLDYMSTHPQAYNALQKHPELIPQIAAVEAKMEAYQMCYIPKEAVADCEKDIPSGCIVAIIGSTPGLDFAHLGFSSRQGDKLQLLHASSTGKKVMLSPGSLSDYLNDIKRFKGIVLLQVLSPED